MNNKLQKELQNEIVDSIYNSEIPETKSDEETLSRSIVLGIENVATVGSLFAWGMGMTSPLVPIGVLAGSMYADTKIFKKNVIDADYDEDLD